jgi:hypothetical protein
MRRKDKGKKRKVKEFRSNKGYKTKRKSFRKINVASKTQKRELIHLV